jgi:hypothetical protein
VLAFVALALAVAQPAAPTPAQLLSTYAPIVHFHPAEQFRPVPVETFLAASVLERRTAAGWEPAELPALPVDAGPWRLNHRACDPSIGVASLDCYAATPSGPPTVYGRYARTPNRIVLQYWLFSTYDFWSGLFPQSDFLWQVHEGDWEAVTILLSAAGKPLVAGYSQHCSGKRRAWSRVAKQGTHPLVYVALGSHSNWFGPGDHVMDTRCYPQAARVIFEVNLESTLDRTGTAGRVRPRLVRVTDQAPGWMRFRGTWGEDGWFRAPGIDTVRFEAGPVGPAFQAKWRDPVGTVMRWPAG